MCGPLEGLVRLSQDGTEALAHETAKNEEAAEGGGEAGNAVGSALETEDCADVSDWEWGTTTISFSFYAYKYIYIIDSY